MHPVFLKLDQELSRALAGLAPVDLQARSSKEPASWTIHQIVQHLILTYASTTAAIEIRLQKGHPTQSAASAEQRIARFFVLQLGWIPGRNKAPPEVNPDAASALAATTADDLLTEISAALSTMDSVLARAEQHFGSARCHSHFVLGPMSIADWRRFHLVHGRHHLRQIAEIRPVRLL